MVYINNMLNGFNLIWKFIDDFKIWTYSMESFYKQIITIKYYLMI